MTPDLVVRDKNGEVTTVRYEQINMMLLNEFLKAHKKSGDTGSDYCGVEVNSRAAAEGNGSSDRADSKSERADPGKQACPATDRK